jgi:hypothetical protein
MQTCDKTMNLKRKRGQTGRSSPAPNAMAAPSAPPAAPAGLPSRPRRRLTSGHHRLAPGRLLLLAPVRRLASTGSPLDTRAAARRTTPVPPWTGKTGSRRGGGGGDKREKRTCRCRPPRAACLPAPSPAPPLLSAPPDWARGTCRSGWLHAPSRCPRRRRGGAAAAAGVAVAAASGVASAGGG